MNNRKIVISLSPIFIHFLIAQLSGKILTTVFIFGLAMYVFGFFLKSKGELLITIITYFIITFLINLFESNDLLRFFLIAKIFFLIAIINGYLSKKKKRFVLFFPFLFSLFMFFGYNNYISLITGRNSVIIKPFPKISLYDESLNKIKISQKDKIYVLDFWATSCGICIQKFPDFEKKVSEYKDNPNVEFYSVNIPVRKENINDNIALITKKYNYNFNKLYSKDFSPCDSLGFNKFPTLIIIKNGIVHYKGSLILDKDIKIHHIDTEIQRVLKIN